VAWPASCWSSLRGHCTIFISSSSKQSSQFPAYAPS
jgi:hypothetical protein